MAFTEEKFSKQLAIAKLKLDEILELSNSEYNEDVSLAYEQIGGLIKRLELSKDGTTDYLIDTGKDLEVHQTVDCGPQGNHTTISGCSLSN